MIERIANNAFEAFASRLFLLLNHPPMAVLLFKLSILQIRNEKVVTVVVEEEEELPHSIWRCIFIDVSSGCPRCFQVSSTKFPGNISCSPTPCVSCFPCFYVLIKNPTSTTLFIHHYMFLSPPSWCPACTSLKSLVVQEMVFLWWNLCVHTCSHSLLCLPCVDKEYPRSIAFIISSFVSCLLSESSIDALVSTFYHFVHLCK